MYLIQTLFSEFFYTCRCLFRNKVKSVATFSIYRISGKCFVTHNLAKMNKYLFLICLALMTSCVDEFDASTTTTTSDPDNVITNVISNVTGIVVDENGIGISDAEVRLGDETVFSNNNGAYIFKNVIMDKHGVHISAYSNSHFFGSTYVYPISQKTVTSRITLMRLEEVQVFSSTDSVELIVGDLDEILGVLKFSANSFQTKEGDPYEGEVYVYARVLDPTNRSTVDLMPGALVGRNLSGDIGNLISYSMMGIEIYGVEDIPLELISGKTVEIEFPIMNSLVENGPDEIPLWFFDEEKGIWIEEGTATKIIKPSGQNTYSGQVSHFTFWNCDVFEETTFIEGRIVDEAGDGLSNLNVRLTIQNQSISAYDYTDSEGFFKGRVPQGQVFDLEVLTSCGLLTESSIGPFFTDTETIDEMVLPEEDIDSVFVKASGILMDCNGNPIPLGKIQLMENGEFVRFYNANVDGFISFTIDLDCYTGELSMFGYDRNNLLTTDTLYFGYQEFLELGDWVACSDGYPNEVLFNYGLNQEQRFLEDVSFDFSKFRITAMDNDTDLSFEVQLDDYNGPENYTQIDGGFASDLSFGDCSAESLQFDSLGFFIEKDTPTFIQGQFNCLAWTAINETQSGCMSQSVVGSILVSYIVRK